METETIRIGRAGARYHGRDVPALANPAADRSVVPQYGIPGAHRPVLRHGYLPPHPILRDCSLHAARSVVIP